ncbi:unnamed protein product [Caenorhabditis bovis]|uniref:Uncharacterized protein n=1 Tax=Caenorhabditis bovis TaxID=2654633 RepID=A0A8S1F6R7_9PELO|nr:unnamed protein product [Caenorhabditis bovis]
MGRKIKLKRALELDVIDFAENTSAHGIPRAYVSVGFRRYLWLSFFLICLFAFGYQAYLIIVRFNRNDIIVGVEIKFEEIKFPAVTVCNMNPYKNSAAREIGSIRNALEAFELAIDKTDEAIHKRKKRGLRNRRIAPISSMCVDVNGYFQSSPLGYIHCTCEGFVDEHDHLWNCRPQHKWTHRVAEINADGTIATNQCVDGYCVPDSDRKFLAWPLQIDRQNETACISVVDASSTAPSYCTRVSLLSVKACTNCDWLSRCEPGDPDDPNQCMCDETNCFKLKSLARKRAKRERVHEKLLSRYDGLLAVYSHCSCTQQHGCVSMNEGHTNQTCLCFYNKKNGQVWPCYKEDDWEERRCGKCNTFGDCVFTEKPRKNSNACLCAVPIHMCVRVDTPQMNQTLDERVVKFWDILPSTTMSPKIKKKQDRDKAYGYSGVKDRIALRAKAMENIIFAVDALTEEQKWKISYNKSDFIQKCSFNGRECHVKNDFVEYLDPTYGACFTYGLRMGNATNERSGPSYGLRLEVFVNVTEYLPTTEAAGVRLTVHSIGEQPFPDAAGFSAPTGFVSSFGIRMKSMTRLPAPYGDCVKEGKTADFIYTDKSYNTEGCQRSCIQKHLAQTCGCGDPRFPPYRETKNCAVDDPYKRECIKREMHVATRNSKKLGCVCKQPCNQEVYSVSYSASRWPAVAGDLSGCPLGMPAHHCLNYKREQGSMIEVYFEQLNYESLLESEAYGLPNLLSDFGGQLGLWMGVSVITIMEVGIFIFDMFTSIAGLKRNRQRPARKSVTSMRCSGEYKDGI